MSRRSRYSSAPPKFTAEEILSNFTADTPDKSVFGNYRIEDDRLVYRAQSSEDAPRWHDAESFNKARATMGKRIKELDGKLVGERSKLVLVEALTKDTPSYGLKIQYYETNLIAQKVSTPHGTVLLGNSDVLPLVGRTVAYGNVSENRDETEIQQLMRRKGYVMLPLTKLADKDFDTFERIDTSPGDTYTVSRKVSSGYYSEIKDVSVIFGGAMLFKLENKCYLYDCDRREIKYGRLNDFVVQLPKAAPTIADAYEALKPKAVKAAEGNGLTVKRIGNKHFIPVPTPALPVLTLEERLTILGAKCLSGYSGLDASEISMLTGISGITRSDARADQLLTKMPRKGSITGKGRRQDVEQVITIDGTTYYKGLVSSDQRANTTLDQWHVVVEGRPSLDVIAPEKGDDDDL